MRREAVTRTESPSAGRETSGDASGETAISRNSSHEPRTCSILIGKKDLKQNASHAVCLGHAS